MNILGIESSCDETALAVVRNGKRILSNVIASSITSHQPFGGIIPEIASRRQLELINPVAQKALRDSGLSLRQINAIAVTQTPGLIGSLLVGISFARALSLSLFKPIIEVNHIHAHLYSNFLTDKDFRKNTKMPKLPAIGLIVSGGHSNLYLINNFTKFKLLGQTLDDAAGEAFDKVAKILDLGYPGGPVIDKLAQKGKKTSLKFSCADLPGTYNFSFSGIKTAVLYFMKNKKQSQQFKIEDICFAFVNDLTDVLVKKAINACADTKVKTLLVGGGVAANSFLRKKLFEKCQNSGITVFFPPLKLCIDNGAMIAGYAYHWLIIG